MMQEDKDLLLKDLCARLPYGVMVNVKGMVYDNRSCRLTDIHHGLDIYIGVHDGMQYHIESVKPYLFPLSSMTEEQFIELKVFADLIYESDTLELVEWNDNYKTLEFWLEEVPSYCVIKVFDWLNKNHFDYRELIEKGLAIDVTDKNIY